MKAICVDIKEAERVKQELVSKGILCKDYKVEREGNFVYFPVLKKYKNYKVIDVDLKLSEYRLRFEDLAKNELNKEELEKLKTSYDIVGNIAIVEVDRELRSKEKKIGEALLKCNKNIKTVLRRGGSHEGTFRIQKNIFLAGEDKRETLYIESGLKIKLNVDEVYFSPRLGNERLRIARLVKPKEKVLVMFSGCGIYPLVINKYSKAAKVYGVEINQKAHKYALQNVKLNKLNNIKLFCGDVGEVLPELDIRFDRIIMPLPKDAIKFLDLVKMVSKEGTVIHLYAFEENFGMIWEEIKKYFKDINPLNLVKCCQIGPRKYRVCADFEILKK